MAEAGIDISRPFPKPWSDEFFQAADVAVTMGCGDSCPPVLGKRYLARLDGALIVADRYHVAT